MASTSADKRRRLIAATLLALCATAALCLLAPRALGASTGGVSAGGTPTSGSSSGDGASAGGTAAGSKGAKGSTQSKGSSATKGASPRRPATPSKATRGRGSLQVLTIRITRAACTPASSCESNLRRVAERGTLLISGVGLKAGMTVVFPRAYGARPSARISSYTPAARLRKTAAGLVVTVPANAHSGDIMVLIGGGRYTGPYGPITVSAHALRRPAPVAPPIPVSEPASASAFEGQGMWIWYISKSSGGSVASIVAQAHAAGVTTLYVKSSDGPQNFWSQFNPQLVAELHAAGLKVCAWQYVYGSEPVGEAALGAEAVADGADCLVIDAEEQYEGRYAAAQTYIDELRAKIGATYPLGLASFPYVYDHLKFPYSVFLGPGGAQFNLPQMYWKAIGNSVDTVYADTFIDNRIYAAPIFPLGQTYGGVSSEELLRFREEAVDYASKGVSFWDWQETNDAGWAGLSAPLAPLTSVTPNPSYMELATGSKGDPVLWMQEHLASAIPGQETTGIFAAQTASNLEAFQAAHGIAASGICEAATWQALLALTPVPVSWTGGSPAD